MKFPLCVPLAALLFTTPATAGIMDELGRWKDDVGDVLEEARDDVKEEAERAVRRAEEVARKARAEAQRMERRIRKLRDEVKGELDKLGEVGKVLNEAIDATEVALEKSGEVIQQNVGMIEVIETAIVEQKLDPYAIVVESSSSVLGGKIASAISGDRLNSLLDKEILGDIKVIDILLPIQSGLERIDPTGTQECVRRGVITKSAVGGGMILAGSPEMVFQGMSDGASLETAATSVVADCLEANILKKPKEGEGAISDEELARAETERDAAVAEMKANQEESERAEEYFAELKSKYEFYEGILDETKDLAEQAEEAQRKNEEIAKKLAEKMKLAGLDASTYEGIIK